MSEQTKYQDILARRDALNRSEPREYITKQEYAKLKSALTRAKNSGDGHKVLAAVEAAVEVFNEKIWPDDWPLWRIALEDASWDARRGSADYDLSNELHAASLVLFP